MKPRRPLLNIEMFEDRLLPSSFGYIGDIADYTIPHADWNIPGWQVQHPFYSQSDEEVSLRNASSLNNQNYNYNNQINETDSIGTTIPVLTGYSNFTTGTPILIAESNSAFSVITVQITFTDSFLSYGLNSPIALDNVLTLPIEQVTPVINRVSQPPSANPPGGSIESVAPLFKVSSDPTVDGGDSTPNEVESTSPTSIATASATTATPSLFLVSLSQQQSVSNPLAYEQSLASDSHLQSEMILASVSPAGTPGIAALPVSQSLMVANFSTFEAFNVAQQRLTTTNSLNVKAPQSTSHAVHSEELLTSLSPVEVQAPIDVPLSGVLNLDELAFNERVSNVFSSIASLGTEFTQELGQPEAYTWLIAGGLLTAGAGYTVWVNRKTKQIARLAIGGRLLGSWEGGT